MLANSIFKDVEYPKDRGSIEHIIKEYDKLLEHKLYETSRTKKTKYLLHFCCCFIILYILECSWISVGVKVLYVIPSAISIVYDILLAIKIKNNYCKDNKLLYKSQISYLLLVWFFLYDGILAYETVLFGKWTDKEYLISFGILVVFSVLFFIKVRTGLPKRFIKIHLYRNNKKFTLDMIVIAIMQLMVCIAYFKKPYFLLLITTYVGVILYTGIIAYLLFNYHQYDKIQKLKKEIGYIPSKEEK